MPPPPLGPLRFNLAVSELAQVWFNTETPQGQTDRSAATRFHQPTICLATALTGITTRADVLRLPSPAVTRSVSPPLCASWGWWEKVPIGCPGRPASGQEGWEAREGPPTCPPSPRRPSTRRATSRPAPRSRSSTRPGYSARPPPPGTSATATPRAPPTSPRSPTARDYLPLSGDGNGDGGATIGVFDPVGQFGRPPVPRPVRRRARLGPPRADL